MRLNPVIKPVTLDGAAVSDNILIPAGTRWVDINPRTTTVTVQVAVQGGEGNTTGRFFSLLSGQPYRFEAPSGDEFGAFTLNFFAGSAVVVDVVYA